MKDTKIHKQKFGILASKKEEFHDWYTQVVLNAELLDYHDIKGCFIIRPNGMRIWKIIREWFDSKIEELGIEEAYFPMLITKANLEKEKDHLANFNPELAWITKCGEKNLDEPVAIRPTSETIIYPAFAKWLKTHRDLPYKINQWCSVLRWEVKSTLPFIRGREFLWQEGHTAFYTKKEAEEEVYKILDFYAYIYEELLAVPVYKGLKSKLETFGGADYTLSLEAFIPGTGKGVQAATSHHLGQNFSKMFNINVNDDISAESRSFVYQNCWGLTTRSIGIATMIHSDDNGFVCSPRVANIQIVIILCGITQKKTEEEITELKEYAVNIKNVLKESGIRVILDDKDSQTVGYKFNNWEMKGVPLRFEVGFRDLQSSEVCCVRRDTREKKQFKIASVVEDVKKEINEMHKNLYNIALTERNNRTIKVKTFEELFEELQKKNIVLTPWCMSSACEEEIGNKTTVFENGEVKTQGAKSLCIPLENESCEGLKCVNCNKNAVKYTLFGRSY
ncbi:Proline--tRNA [Ecytonucleospora hepatopenaei]|uniref:Proline--tRNA ligase n=1 Tax=Ecytonucleospora hepatopenaei TaxID=646526 RepID=A0A1W0E7W7_9MICR|nr:Proline--tRNA [Ecytonucleospora hepatopenaei]